MATRNSIYKSLSRPRCLLMSSPFIALAIASQGLDAQTTIPVTDMAGLRAAISTANGNSNDYIITLANGTYGITGNGDNTNITGDLDVTKPGGGLTLQGSSQAGTILDGFGADRVLHILSGSGVSVVLRDLTIVNGRATDDGAVTDDAFGGGIYNDGGSNLTLSRVTVQSCNATGASGGATGTGAGGVARGGGIYTDGGAVLIENCVIDTNSAWGGGGATGLYSGQSGSEGGAAEGGGIYISGTGNVTIRHTTFSANQAWGAPGGFGAGGSFSSNGGQGGQGGRAAGGAIYANGSSLTIERSTLESNSALSGDGGGGGDGAFGSFNGGDGGQGGDAGETEGAGMYVAGGTVIINNSTLSANIATSGDGGNGGDGGDASFSGFGGDGANGGDGGNAWGCGISAVGGTLTIYSSTIAGNTGTAGTQGNGGSAGFGSVVMGASGIAGSPGTTYGGGIYAAGGTVTLESTIVADNAADSGPQAGGSLTANASLFESDAGVSITNPGLPNVLNVDPGLAPLALNGGVTRNHAIATSSPAFNTGSNILAEAFDQRGGGFSRTRDGTPDIGSFEVQTGSGSGGASKKKKKNEDCSTGDSGGGSPLLFGTMLGALLLALRGAWRRFAG